MCACGRAGLGGCLAVLLVVAWRALRDSVNELLNAQLKTDLALARDTIRTSGTLFMSSFRAHLIDTKEANARQARDLSAQSVLEAVKEIERIVSTVDGVEPVSAVAAGRIAVAYSNASDAVRVAPRLCRAGLWVGTGAAAPQRLRPLTRRGSQIAVSR